MYAVIKTGGKQHKVKPGDVIEVEHLDVAAGEGVTFTPLLVVDDDGKTYFGKDATGATVSGSLLGEEKGKKVKVFKYRAKTGYSRRQGHRQLYSLVQIQDVRLTPAPTDQRPEQEARERPEQEAGERPEQEAGEPIEQEGAEP